MGKEENKVVFWKDTSTDRKFLMLVLLGFLFVAFDQHVICSWLNGIFPVFDQSAKINPEFQLYTLNYIYGMKANIYEYTIGEISYNLKVDVFSDLLGYIMIAIGLIKLSGKTKIFNISVMTSVIAIILYMGIRVLPFVLNGEVLSYVCFWLAIAQFGIDICIGYMFVYGICDLLSGYQYVRDRKAIVIAWFATIILNGTVMVLYWMSPVINGVLMTFYNIFDLGVNLLFVYFVLKNREYILGEKTA